MIAKSKILDKMLNPVITPAVAAELLTLRADEATQARINELAHKCNEGQLTSDERDEYEEFVSAISFITLLQAKARKVLKEQSQ